MLHQGNGQAAAPPIPLNSDGQVSRIVVHEDGIALATVKVLHGTEHTTVVPVRIHLSEAQDLGKEGQLACKPLHTCKWPCKGSCMMPNGIDTSCLPFCSLSAACCILLPSVNVTSGMFACSTPFLQDDVNPPASATSCVGRGASSALLALLTYKEYFWSQAAKLLSFVHLTGMLS